MTMQVVKYRTGRGFFLCIYTESTVLTNDDIETFSRTAAIANCTLPANTVACCVLTFPYVPGIGTPDLVYVAENYRRQGLATRLFDECWELLPKPRRLEPPQFLTKLGEAHWRSYILKRGMSLDLLKGIYEHS